jgi:Mn-dependent DtxR family transcriptional regulator
MSLTPVQRAVLVDLLVYGDNTAGGIAQHCSYERNSITNRLSGMAEKGLIRDKGKNVYELTDKGKQRARALVKAGENPWE